MSVNPTPTWNLDPLRLDALRRAFTGLSDSARVAVTVEVTPHGAPTAERLHLVQGATPAAAMKAMRRFIGATAVEVPEYARAVADALVAARARLEGPLPIEVRPLVEREAQTLGATLGSLLARQYLEAMDA